MSSYLKRTLNWVFSFQPQPQPSQLFLGETKVDTNSSILVAQCWGARFKWINLNTDALREFTQSLNSYFSRFSPWSGLGDVHGGWSARFKSVSGRRVPLCVGKERQHTQLLITEANNTGLSMHNKGVRGRVGCGTPPLRRSLGQLNVTHSPEWRGAFISRGIFANISKM